MKPEEIKARLFLEAVLADIAPLIEVDPRAAALTKGWNNVIQFKVENGGPASYLEFTNGKLKAVPGVHGNPTVLFSFDNVGKLLEMMDGKGKPKIKKGILHIFLLLKFMKLSALLEKTLQPEESTLADPAALKRTVTLMLNTAVNGMKVIAECDDSVADVVKHMGDGTAQIDIMPDGPNAYVEVKSSKLTPVYGTSQNPEVVMELKDTQIAYKVFKGEIDAMAAIGTCDIVLRGFLPLFGDLSYLMGKIDKYLA